MKKLILKFKLYNLKKRMYLISFQISILSCDLKKETNKTLAFHFLTYELDSQIKSFQVLLKIYKELNSKINE